MKIVGDETQRIARRPWWIEQAGVQSCRSERDRYLEAAGLAAKVKVKLSVDKTRR